MLLKKKVKALFAIILVFCVVCSNWMIPKASALGEDAEDTIYYGANTSLMGDDDYVFNLPIGFDFKFYGQDYTTASASINGVLFMGNNAVYNYSECPLSQGVIKNCIAAFWDDLITDGAGHKESIYYYTVGDPGSRKFIMQWTNMYYFSTTLQMGTFQVILYEGSNDIQIQYRTLINGSSNGRCYGSSAAVGIVNSNASQYDQYEIDTPNSITEKQAIRYSWNGSTYIRNNSADYDHVYLLDRNCPSVPQLTSGVLYNGATNVPTNVNLEWSASDRATSYQVLVSTSSTFTNPMIFQTTSTSYPLTGLSNNTLYYWRVEADNDFGSSMSDVSNFQTVAANVHQPSAVTTQAATSVSYTTAQLNGTVTDTGIPAITQYGFVWNTAGDPTTADSKVQLKTRYSTGAFTANITGLHENTNYYVRTYATNDSGTVYGNLITLTTAAYPHAGFTVKDGNMALAGANVNINGANITTDSNGQAQVSLPEGTYSYTVSASGYLDSTGTATVTSSGIQTDISLSRATRSFTICVKDGTTPVEGASVRIGESAVTTDSNGNAIFSNLPWNSYNYTVSRAGYADKTGTVTIASNGTVTNNSVDLSSSRNTFDLTISVKDGTAPVEGASVRIGDSAVTTDSNGDAVFPNLPWGSYNYSISQAGYTDKTGMVAMAIDGTVSNNTIDLSSSRSTYDLTISIKDGMAPVEGASVRIGDSAVTTDSNGDAVFPNLPWGSYNYSVSRAGYADKTGMVAMAADGTVSNNSTDLSSSRSTYDLTISVQDGTAPVEGASVRIGDSTVTTDSSGNAVFSNLPWGSYNYTVSQAGYADKTGMVTMAADGAVSNNSTDLSSSRSTYNLTISVQDGTAPVKGASVRIGDSAVTTDSNGDAVFPNLPWGSYNYTISMPYYNVQSGTASLGIGGGTVSASITYADSDGDGIPDIRDQYPTDPSKSYDEQTVDPNTGISHVISASNSESSGESALAQEASVTSDNLHAYKSGDTSDFEFTNAVVTIPVELLDSKIGTDLSSKIVIRLDENNSQTSSQGGKILVEGEGYSLLKSYDFNMFKVFSSGVSEQIHQLGGKIKIAIPLDDSLRGIDPNTLEIYYYNPETQTVEAMHATYDAATNSLVFYTTHFSAYILGEKTQATVENPNTGDSPRGSNLPVLFALGVILTLAAAFTKITKKAGSVSKY